MRIHKPFIRRIWYFAAVLVVFPVSLQALTPQSLSLKDMIVNSDAVIVATIRSVDEQASTDMDNPLTRVELDVSRVLYGSLTNPNSLSLVFRGGVTPFGRRQVFGNVPAFEISNKYVMFLRTNYYISPLIPTVNNLLRAVEIQGRQVAVTADNQTIRASARHGLLYVDSFSEPVTQTAETAIEPSNGPRPDADQAVAGGVFPADEHLISRAAAPASDFDQVIRLIGGTGVQARSEVAQAMIPIPEVLTPQQLPNLENNQ